MSPGKCADPSTCAIHGHDEEDDRVRPAIKELVKRGQVTPEEIAELRCNSWEWEALVPAMNREAYEKHVQHALDNCDRPRRPCSTYDQAVVAVHAPELLKRWQRADSAAHEFGDTVDAVRVSLGQKETHYLNMPDDVRVAVKILRLIADGRFSNPADAARGTLAYLQNGYETPLPNPDIHEKKARPCEECDGRLVVDLDNGTGTTIPCPTCQGKKS